MATYGDAAGQLTAAAQCASQAVGQASEGVSDLDGVVGMLAAIGHESGAQQAMAARSEVESYQAQVQKLVSTGEELATRIAALGEGGAGSPGYAGPGAEFLRGLTPATSRRGYSGSAERKRRQQDQPPAQPGRWRTAEAITLGSTVAGTAWAGVGELLSVLPKSVGGMMVGAIGVWAAWKTYKRKG